MKKQKQPKEPKLEIKREAFFSECGNYRYTLSRTWDDSLPKAMCIGLNPSNANAEKDDSTIRILIKMLHRLGYGGLIMTNLFSCITSKPSRIFDFANPESIHWQTLLTVRSQCKDVIFCWGQFKQTLRRGKKAKDLFPDALCFGWNDDGSRSRSSQPGC